MKKIELNILIFIIIEAIFLLYGFKINLINIILGTLLGIILINIFNKIKKNKI
jgi:ABC-type lipoprotein release transport system permease subunit